MEAEKVPQQAATQRQATLLSLLILLVTALLLSHKTCQDCARGLRHAQEQRQALEGIHPSPNKKTAVAVNVLFANGNRAEWGEAVAEVAEGACVLQHSMRKHRGENLLLSFHVLVPNVSDVHPHLASTLAACGFALRETTLQLPSTDAFDDERKAAILDRAVGLVELLKLESLLMTEYDAVLCLDADMMFVGPFDDLVAPYTAAPYRLSYDFNGGMTVYYPHNDGARHVARLLEVFRSAPWSAIGGYAGTGFGDAHGLIGLSGGPMLQGLLPYYLQLLGLNPRDPDHGIARCKHNYYYVPPEKPFHCTDYRGPIHSVHFKGASLPKPWECGALDRLKDECPVLTWLQRVTESAAIADTNMSLVPQRERCSYMQNLFLVEHAEVLHQVFRRDAKTGCADGQFHGILYHTNRTVPQRARRGVRPAAQAAAASRLGADVGEASKRQFFLENHVYRASDDVGETPRAPSPLTSHTLRELRMSQRGGGSATLFHRRVSSGDAIARKSSQ